MVAFIWQCVSLPSMKSPRAPQRQGTVLRLFRRSTVSLGLLACGLFFMGQFTLFTYVRPFLETVTEVSPSGLSLILLAIGVAGFVGTLLITTVLNARFYPTLVAIPLLMAAIAGTLLLAGHHTVGRRTVKPVGPAGDGGAHRLVDMDCADAARGCGGGRWSDGRRDPAIDCPRVNGRRPGV
jgi:predicted MFS family arabinose efflux permease